jgi:hypothetical protein
MKKEEVGEEPNQLVKGVRDESRDQSDCGREKGNQHDAKLCRG